MSLANRSFRNNKTGEIVKVIDSFENIAILENKQKVDVRALTDINYYTEQIDPGNFFNTQGAYNLLADKIKNIPQSVLSNFNDESVADENISDKFGSDYNITPQMNESAIIMSTEEDEKAELARKYGASLDTSSQVSRQNEAFARILGEDAEDELPVVPQTQYVEQPPVVRVEAERPVVEAERPVVNEYKASVVSEDPIITMFRKTKRNVELNIAIDIFEKIPRLDFIEMMEDSYETSMIDFLADEFTNKILQDPSIIRNKIKDKINELVYGTEVKESINSQITDSVTQVEKPESLPAEKEPVLSKELETPKKTTRKPRAKKESTEK
jgi:hypothetical protein